MISNWDYICFRVLVVYRGGFGASRDCAEDFVFGNLSEFRFVSERVGNQEGEA